MLKAIKFCGDGFVVLEAGGFPDLRFGGIFERETLLYIILSATHLSFVGDGWE